MGSTKSATYQKYYVRGNARRVCVRDKARARGGPTRWRRRRRAGPRTAPSAAGREQCRHTWRRCQEGSCKEGVALPRRGGTVNNNRGAGKKGSAPMRCSSEPASSWYALASVMARSLNLCSAARAERAAVGRARGGRPRSKRVATSRTHASRRVRIDGARRHRGRASGARVEELPPIIWLMVPHTTANGRPEARASEPIPQGLEYNE